jgi:RNA polymerase sigma factor (sigma-70 family)
MSVDPIELIARDPHALEIFYRVHVEAIQRFVTRRVNDPYLAADLTADVFLAAIEAAPRYSAARGNPQAWLFGIARNVVSAERRRAARELRAYVRVDGQRFLADDDIERMNDRIDAGREARALYSALLDLPKGERAVLELVVIDGLSVTEAATALGLRAVTARVRLHRARTSMSRLQLGTPASPLVTPLETS